MLLACPNRRLRSLAPIHHPLCMRLVLPRFSNAGVMCKASDSCLCRSQRCACPVPTYPAVTVSELASAECVVCTIVSSCLSACNTHTRPAASSQLYRGRKMPVQSPHSSVSTRAALAAASWAATRGAPAATSGRGCIVNPPGTATAVALRTGGTYSLSQLWSSQFSASLLKAGRSCTAWFTQHSTTQQPVSTHAQAPRQGCSPALAGQCGWRGRRTAQPAAGPVLHCCSRFKRTYSSELTVSSTCPSPGAAPGCRAATCRAAPA